MARDGDSLKNRKGAYGPLESMELIAGRVIGHKDGFGFVVPDNGSEDLFISPRQMRFIFHGDRVLTHVSHIDGRGRREGIIVEVLEHNTQQLVGRFYNESGVTYVEPSNQRLNQSILIPPDDNPFCSTWPNGGGSHYLATDSTHHVQLGKVIEVLGDHMAPGMEINVAIRNHELPYIWPDDVSLEAARFPSEVVESDLQGREDFRYLPSSLSMVKL